MARIRRPAHCLPIPLLDEDIERPAIQSASASARAGVRVRNSFSYDQLGPSRVGGRRTRCSRGILGCRGRTWRGRDKSSSADDPTEHWTECVLFSLTSDCAVGCPRHLVLTLSQSRWVSHGTDLGIPGGRAGGLETSTTRFFICSYVRVSRDGGRERWYASRCT